MRIGELAHRLGVKPSKIRFYESRNLLPPIARLPNGYRDYGHDALRTIEFIQRAQGFGFTLQEVAAHLRSRRGEGRKARLQARLETKVAEFDVLMGELAARRKILLGLIEEVKAIRAEGAAPPGR